MVGRPPNTRPVAIAKMLAKRDITAGGCWEWMGCRLHFGHGAIQCEGRFVRTHRLAYEEWVGPIPEGAHVLHHCDNPPCFNPEHLFLGSEADNRRDCVEKGRQAKGERVNTARLTEADARAILASTEPAKVLAERYGVRSLAVRRIRQRLAWKHL